MKNKPQICTRCVMDNIGDETVVFQPDGTCNYCNYALSRKDIIYFPNQEGKQELDRIIQELKNKGKNRKYDCLMGISGGLDSAYLAYLGDKKWGLRILAVHIDDGFDSDIAKRNISNLIAKSHHIQLVSEKPDKVRYTDLLRAFIRAGVPNIAIPQDNVLLACLCKYAKKYRFKYFLSGSNFSLESILQRGNTHVAADGAHVKAIHRMCGEVPLGNLPLTSLFERYVTQKYIYRISTLRPLDLIDYNRARAIKELHDEMDFDYYGGKHYESVFTKFAQSYYLPKKFGVDKRKSHFSSLIISGQMTRAEALEELKKPLYEKKQMEEDIEFILRQIGMSRGEFDKIMQKPGVPHRKYAVSKLSHFAGLARKMRKFLSD